MVRVEHAVTIARPPSEVFAYLTDMQNLPEWQATAIEGRLESERMEQGARTAEVRKFWGQTMESTFEVTGYEPDRRFDFESVSGPVAFKVSHVLEPDDGGTRLEFAFEGDPGDQNVDEQQLERQVRRQVEDDFRTLKILLETAVS
jgi:uncharacterized protein YndB with AHSA1/START domain